MSQCYAIVPDDREEPVAVFDDLEDAMEWALRKFGGDKFRIKHVEYVEAGGEGSSFN
jgi:hypothetical protein